MFELIKYQSEAISSLRQGFKDGHTRQILALPTGAGKTVIAAAIAHGAKKHGRKVLFLVDRIQLACQALKTFRASGLTTGIMQGENLERFPDEDILVATIQTLSARLRLGGWVLLDSIGVIIIDEVHILHENHIKILDQLNALPVIGLSATPERKGLDKHFTNMVVGATIKSLIADGHLVPSRAFVPSAPDLSGVKITAGDYNEAQLAERMNIPKLTADIISTWKEKGENRQTLVFAVNIAHSQTIARQFREEGFDFEHIDAYTDSDERQDIIHRFNAGNLQGLSSVGVLSIGFDSPIASCAILARPTKSRMLYIQQVGRVLRPAPGKSDAIILDHAGNLQEHGFHENYEPRMVSGSKPKKKGDLKVRKAMVCMECQTAFTVGAEECPECGWAPERKPTIIMVDGELVEYVSGTVPKPGKPKEVDGQTFIRELVGYRLTKGYQKGWAWHKYAERMHVHPKNSWWGEANRNPLPPSPETIRWIQSRTIAYNASRKHG